MYFKIVLFTCAAIATANAGYLGAGLRYAAPIGFAAPAIGYAAPAIARVEHLAPAVSSVHRTELFTAPIARTSLVAPAIRTVAAAPLIAPAPLLRTGYLNHGFGYGIASGSYGFARSLPLGYAGAYRAGW
ncbi:cuticle protein 38 [Photinus pyralis]|uniref:cuticle protein 38 n=1 Tax=Photinus pyralis TaxID=7054 RepID=UPI00126752C8|nr:cuticle protein 38 [Photinus pyralis]